MKRKLSSILLVPLLLGFTAAWAQDEDPDLPVPAADEAREAAQLPDTAANGLDVAAEATIRLMDDEDDESSHDVQLPELPEAGAAGEQGLETAADAIAGGQSFGMDVADSARDTAQDAAENRGRAEDLPLDVPGRPETVPPVEPPTPPTS